MEASIARDTITSLSEERQPGEYVFKTKKGSHFIMRVSSEQDSVDTDKDLEPLSDDRTCNTDEFEGRDRAQVKTSKSNAPLETNMNVKTLFTQLSENEENLCEERDTFENDRRKSIENRNVQLETIFLYTFKRQKDEDYHLVVGSTDNSETAYFFNVEISGEPPSGSNGRNQILGARNDFEDYFGIREACASSYYRQDFRESPIPVIVTGSLFFDAFHCSSFQNSGPQNWPEIVLQTAWEIHPITKIEFIE